MEISKYDIVFVKDTFRGQSGSVQRYSRPAVILQNNKGNIFSPTTIVAFMTSHIKKEDLPTHVVLDDYKLFKRSMVMLEQVATIDKTKIVEKIDRLNRLDRMKIDTALLVSLGYIDTERK